MNSQELYDKWQVQLRKGYIELCVLTALNQKGKTYGLALLQQLEMAQVHVNEGTLYPLLNRMDKNGWLQSTWNTNTQTGHPRREYELSEIGIELHDDMMKTYLNNTHALAVLGEDK